MNKVVLCSTTELLNHPQYLGLNIDAKRIKDLDWLTCYTDGTLFRQYCNELKEPAEIWIISADNIDAINLAAAVKQDRPDLNVCVVAFDLSGSLQSRAGCAQIDAVMSKEMFCERFMAYAHSQNDVVIQKPQNVVSSVNVANTFEANGSSLGKQGFLLPIVSATGGAGKSAVSVMSSVLSQLAGNKTLLVDANLQFSELSNMLDAKNTIPVDVLLADPAKISELEPTETSPAVLAAPTKPELAENVILEIPKLIDSLRASFECIIVNTGSYWNELTASLLERASKSLFIVDQRPSSLTATKSAIDLCTRCGIATTSFLFAINRCKKGVLYSAVDVSCALGGVSVAEISDGGIDVDNAFMSKNPLDLIESKNAFAISMWNIVSSILPNKPGFDDKQQQGRASFDMGGEKKSKRARRKPRARKSVRRKRA